MALDSIEKLSNMDVILCNESLNNVKRWISKWQIGKLCSDRSSFDYLPLIIISLENKKDDFSFFYGELLISLWNFKQNHIMQFSTAIFTQKSNADSHNQRNYIFSIGFNVNLNIEYLPKT